MGILRQTGLWKRWLLLVACAVAFCALLAAIHVFRQQASFTATTELLVDPADLVTTSTDGGTGSARPDPSSLDSQVYVMQSRRVLDAIATELDLASDPAFGSQRTSSNRAATAAQNAVAERLRSRLTITRAGKSSVFRITAQHPDGTRAAQIADTAANVYLRQLREARNEETKRTADALAAKANELGESVHKADLALQTFRAENGLVGAEQLGQLADQQLASLNQQLLDARNAEEQQRTIYEQARNLTVGSLEQGTIPEVLQSGAIARLRERFDALQERYSELAIHLGPDHPQMRALDTQMTSVKQTMRTEIDRLRQSLQSSYQRATANTRSLAGQLETLTKASVDSAAVRSRLRQLETEAEAARTPYREAMDRVEEYSRQQSLVTLNSRILTAAVPVETQPPVRTWPLLGAVLLGGLAIGSGLTFLTGLPVSRRLTEQTLVKQTGFPILGRVSSAAQTTRKSSGLARFLRIGRSPRTASPRAANDGIRNVADRLQAAMPTGRRGTVLLIGIGDLNEPRAVAADIVQELIDAGRDILYAPGALKPKVTRLGTEPRQGVMGLADAATEGSAPLADLLKYEHLPSAAKVTAFAGIGRTFSRYDSISHPSNADMVVINACGTPAAKCLPQLVHEADTIVVLMEIGRTSGSDVDDLLETLGYSRDIVLGIVLVEPT
ncbi:MAG: hypothetical protein DI528_10040 [Shinella sp.]|nr:MAG: hypothetical protein DI528_10040 [Shinella sp.]